MASSEKQKENFRDVRRFAKVFYKNSKKEVGWIVDPLTKGKIEKVWEESYRQYGRDKIFLHGIKFYSNFSSLRKTRHYCINLGICSSRFGSKKSKPKESKVRGGSGSDLINRNFNSCDAHERVFTDVTFIRIKSEGWVYLSTIIDGRTTWVAGY